MENEKLKQIIELINNYYNEKLITDEELIAIADYCLKTSNYNLGLKNFNIYSLESSINRIPDGIKYIAKFDSDLNLKNYKTKLELNIDDLQDCYDNESNLDVYFDDDGNGKLKISLNHSQYNQKNSIALKAIDDYSKSNNNKYGFPTRITILYSDIREIYEILDANKHAKAILNTAVSLSNNNNYKGRISLVLVLDTGAKTNTYYDTFCLTPPDNC